MFSEALWIFVVLAAWIAGFQLLRHFRSRTSSYANHQAFKSELAPWVKQLEFYSLAIALTAYVLLGCAGIAYLYRALHPQAQLSGLAAVLTMLAVAIPAVVLAMLTTNIISWMIPPARAANLQAMSGAGDISFASLNRGLLIFGLVVTPICVIQGLIGLFEPWSR